MSSKTSSARSSLSAKRGKKAPSKTENIFDAESLKDDQEYNELLSLTIPELRKEKTEAIKQMNFVRSGKIGVAIQTLSQGGDNGFYEKVEKELGVYVDSLFAGYDQALEEEMNKLEENEKTVRINTHNSFEDYKKEQFERVKALEIERQIQILLANTRRIAETVRLEQKAKTLASMDKAQEAIETLELAKKTEANERQKMIDEINKKYDTLIHKYLLQAKQDLDSLQNRLNESIQNYKEINHQKEIELCKKYAAMIRGAPQKILNQMYNQEVKIKKEKGKDTETDPNKVKRQLNDLYQKLIAFVEGKINSEGRSYIYVNAQQSKNQP